MQHKIKTLTLALAICLGLFTGCTTTTTTTPTGSVTTKQFDVQTTAEAVALAEQVLANPLVSNAVYSAISGK